jgi:methyl-accepting chemotaxis protein
MTHANRAQSASAARLIAQIAEIRRITERNAEGVRQTRGSTADLIKQAESLTGLMDSAIAGRSTNGNGRAR